MTIELDTTELRMFAVTLGDIPDAMVGESRAIVQRGALNIKNQMIADARDSEYFDALARSITYDTAIDADGITAEIGPDRARSGGAGLLGAYFGWSRGGGATVPDPIDALNAEGKVVVRFLSEAMARALR